MFCTHFDFLWRFCCFQLLFLFVDTLCVCDGGGGGIFGAVHSLREVLMGIRCLIFMSLCV